MSDCIHMNENNDFKSVLVQTFQAMTNLIEFDRLTCRFDHLVDQHTIIGDFTSSTNNTKKLLSRTMAKHLHVAKQFDIPIIIIFSHAFNTYGLNFDRKACKTVKLTNTTANRSEQSDGSIAHVTATDGEPISKFGCCLPGAAIVSPTASAATAIITSIFDGLTSTKAADVLQNKLSDDYTCDICLFL